MTTVTADTVVSRNPAVMVAAVPDGYVMLSAEAGRYLEFNATAAAVWDLLETSRTVDAVCAAVQARFEVDAARCEAEVHALITQLVNAGALCIET